MKKRILVIITVLLMLLVVTAEAGQLDVCNGIRLGMSKKDVISYFIRQGESLSAMGIFEAEVAEQPFSVVQLCFEEVGSEFNAWEMDEAEAAVNYMTSMIAIEMYKDGDYSLMENDDRDDYLLAQVRVFITSDQKYVTAVETFQAVEEYLTQEYGVTRYTSRRGESLPMISGYGAFKPFVITRDVLFSPRDLFSTIQVSDYSQRIIEINSGAWLVIDHHIYIEGTTTGTGFVHEIIYSIIPIDISNQYNLLEKPTATPEVSETPSPLITEEPTPNPTPIITPTPYIVTTPDPTEPPVITDETILYFNPTGGERYHLDQNCKTINSKYLPLSGQFTFSEINDPQYENLQPCFVCGAPSKPIKPIVVVENDQNQKEVEYISDPKVEDILESLEAGSLDEAIITYSEFFNTEKDEKYYKANDQIDYQSFSDAYSLLKNAHEYEMSHLTALPQEHMNKLREAEASLLKYLLAVRPEKDVLISLMTELTRVMAGIY